MNSAQYSVLSGQYSVASAWDNGSWGLGMFNPFATEAVHDRIRHEIEMACVDNERKGSRLMHLAAAQRAFHRDVDNVTMYGRHVPQSLYGTLKAMKEKFRSEAVEETGITVGEQLSLFSMPTTEDLERYATQAKLNLLDTIVALEKARLKCGETLGPTIERLRKETEKSCSNAWCKEDYVNLVATHEELHQELADETREYLKEGGKGRVDPPDIDASSLIDDEIRPCSTHEELENQSDQVILNKLKNAAASFLDHYAAVLSLIPSLAGTKSEAEADVELELPAGFGCDSKKLKRPSADIHKIRVLKKGSAENGDALNAQDADDHLKQQQTGESESSEEDITDDPNASEDPITTEDPNASENPETTDDPDATDDQERQNLQDPPLGGGLDPDGLEPAGSKASVGISSSKGKKRKPLGGADQGSVLDGDRNHRKSPIEIFLGSDVQEQQHMVGDPETPAESSIGRCSQLQGNGNLAKADAGSFHSNQPPINAANSSDGSQARPRMYTAEEAAKLDQASASVWKKLKKLTNKKKKFAVTMFGEVINEIEDIDIASSPRDEVSLASHGTQDNPIVLVDESHILELPIAAADNQASHMRRAPSEAGSLSSKDAARIMGLEDQSQVSGLTAATSLTANTRYSRRSEMKEDLQELVGEYIGSRAQQEGVVDSDARLEAVEKVLSSLKAHMNGRHENQVNNGYGVEESQLDVNKDYGRNPNGPYMAHQQSASSYTSEPEIIQVIEDPKHQVVQHQAPFIDLVSLDSGYGRPEVVVTSRPRSKLLADPNRHALIVDDMPDESSISIPRHRPKLLADPNKHAMIDVGWDPTYQADAPAGMGYANTPTEQRDDQQGVSSLYFQGGFEPDGARDNANPYSRFDPTYEEKTGLFRDRKPSSYTSLPSDLDSKSATSSILGKRIPGRAKSVSFNLPDDDKSNLSAKSKASRRSLSGKSRGSSKAVGSRSSRGERVTAARRELARLSQRQAMLAAGRGPQLAQGTIYNN